MPPRAMSRKCAVGVGTTRTGRLREYNPYGLGISALKEALAEADARQKAPH